MKRAAYDEILNQMMQCGRHAVVIKDDNEPLDDDVTHCVVTTGATIANDGKAQNGAKKKYIIKKRLHAVLRIVSERYLDCFQRMVGFKKRHEEVRQRGGLRDSRRRRDLEHGNRWARWENFNSTSVHRKNKENYLRICGGNENKNERGVFGSSESDSLMLTRTARSAKHIEAAKNSGIFNGLKIVVDVPDFFFSLNSSDGKNNKKSSTTITTSRTEWTIRKSDCERILESAGAEVIRERDYVVLDSYFGENETYSPVPDSEEDEEDEEDERNLKQHHHEKQQQQQQQQQQQMSKNDVKFQEKTCASIDYVFLDEHIRTNAWIANHRKNEADVPKRESCRLALVRPLVSKRVHVRNGRYIRNASLRSIPSRKLSIMNRCLALSFDTAYFFKIHVYNKNNFQVSADCQSYAHLLSFLRRNF